MSGASPTATASTQLMLATRLMPGRQFGPCGLASPAGSLDSCIGVGSRNWKKRAVGTTDRPRGCWLNRPGGEGRARRGALRRQGDQQPEQTVLVKRSVGPCGRLRLRHTRRRVGSLPAWRGPCRSAPRSRPRVPSGERCRDHGTCRRPPDASGDIGSRPQGGQLPSGPAPPGRRPRVRTGQNHPSKVRLDSLSDASLNLSFFTYESWRAPPLRPVLSPTSSPTHASPPAPATSSPKKP